MSLLIIAHLSSPFAGDAPMLDGILEFEMAQRQGLADKIRRDKRCPPVGEIHIPMLRHFIGGWNVPCCSSPIYGPIVNDRHEHIAKRLGCEYADELAPESRNVVAIGNSTFKSYRLPLRIRSVKRIAWLGEGHRRPVLKLLRSVHSIGKKRSVGYGRVAEWTGENVDGEFHWFAESESGRVLMRPLPFGNWLPPGLLGARRDFGGVVPPYWHPDRATDIIVPA